MFARNLELQHDSKDDSLELYRTLRHQADCFRERLSTSMDNNDLSSAVAIAERSVGNDCIVALLAMVQSVKRDVQSEFKPILDEEDCISLAVSEMADAALLTLSSLYIVAEAFIRLYGWIPIDLSSNVQGGIIYEHKISNEISEDPDIDGMSWQMKLMLSIPILIEPGCLDGQLVWAANVVFYQRLHSEDSNKLERFSLEADASNQNCVSVIDVIKSDEDGQSSVMRGTHHGCWRGLYAETIGEMDVSRPLGDSLETWVETTIAGLSVIESQARILVFGIGSGQLVSFLHKYNPDIQLHIIEESAINVDIALKYYNLSSTVHECVTVSNLLDFIQNQSSNDFTYDTIIVNNCSSDDEFSSFLKNEKFFNGLLSLLSHHPVATLLVNCDLNMVSVAAIVAKACQNEYGHKNGSMLILREYLLRDYFDMAKERTILAVRRREWSLTVADWNREHIGEDAETSGAMSVADAQNTCVVRLKKFLSEYDIQQIHSVAKQELEITKALSLRKARSNSTALQCHTDAWRVLYLQHNNIFQRKLPELRERILNKIREVDRDNWSLIDNVKHVNIRVVEYHQMDEFGELADPKHYDLNSLLTMDMMLSDECDFEGGQFQTEESDGSLKQYSFEKGDALVFVSHKPHCVNKVRSGRRNVLVLEFWYGPERQCPHRCEKFGQLICTKDPAQKNHTLANPTLNRNKSRLLPFRLGSVSSSKEGCYEIIELLWEPSTTSGATLNVPSQLSKEAEASLEQAWDLFD
jgi:hypothetical protein